jgi:hypothetical protein
LTHPAGQPDETPVEQAALPSSAEEGNLLYQKDLQLTIAFQVGGPEKQSHEAINERHCLDREEQLSYGRMN